MNDSQAMVAQSGELAKRSEARKAVWEAVRVGDFLKAHSIVSRFSATQVATRETTVGISTYKVVDAFMAQPENQEPEPEPDSLPGAVDWR
jgi:hypothetical protein